VSLACSKENNDGPELYSARDYFPLDSSNYWIYDATFINIDAAVGTFDTLRLELKMEYTYFDESIQEHVLNRFTRVDSTQSWSEYDVISIAWDALTMQWVEDNLRFVKLTDPVYNNKSWNGNSYNILDDWNYYYSDLNTSFEYEEYTFSETIRVEKRDVKNVIQEQRAFEVFAKDVGSVYEYEANFTFQSGAVALGKSRELVLIKFGEE
jgi:hypothetical protein